ncbi:hypothetical protein X975_15519, partial [Stegodyphus mimosarum]
MDRDLIEVCQEMRNELHLYSTPPNSTVDSRRLLNDEEFVERVNTLLDRLHLLQEAISQKQKDTQFLKQMQTEMCQYSAEYEYLRKQAAQLEVINPELREEVNKRCNILSNKWELLEYTLYPKRRQEREG